jgi:hypothetical protein
VRRVTAAPYRFGGMGIATSSTINSGTIALDTDDAAARELEWKGQASKTLSGETHLEAGQHNIDKAIAKLLTDFAPMVNT